jgi:hypothetical protein
MKTDKPAFKWQRLRLPALVVVPAYEQLWGVPIALLGASPEKFASIPLPHGSWQNTWEQ